MHRLYLRIYFAVLASLGVFTLAAGLAWHFFGDDTAAGRTQQLAATLARNTLPPAGAPRAEQQAALERLGAGLDFDVALFAADRTPLAGVGAPLPAPEGERSGWSYGWRSPPVWTMRLEDGRWLAARAPHGHRPAGLRLFLSLALLALAVGIGAYPMARRLTRRLERLQAGVESLGAGDLAARVRIEGRDEVARLAASFNRAAARIEELVAANKSLLANASHELRTPLARIRMAVELMKTQADPERKAGLERDIAELDALIDEILLASRLDAVRELDAVEEVDVLALAAEEAARYDAAEAHGKSAVVRGDPRLLRRMIRNLLENAVRHGAPPIELRVDASAQGVELSVSDRGPGIAPAERERVFEPFYRRGAGGGAGLGLALVRTIARRHGGEARVDARGVVVVTLPAR